MLLIIIVDLEELIDVISVDFKCADPMRWDKAWMVMMTISVDLGV